MGPDGLSLAQDTNILGLSGPLKGFLGIHRRMCVCIYIYIQICICTYTMYSHIQVQANTQTIGLMLWLFGRLWTTQSSKTPCPGVYTYHVQHEVHEIGQVPGGLTGLARDVRGCRDNGVAFNSSSQSRTCESCRPTVSKLT